MTITHLAEQLVQRKSVTPIFNAARRDFNSFLLEESHSENTAQCYEEALNQFTERLELQSGRVSIAAASAESIQDYIDDLQATHSPSTVKQHLAALRKYYSWLVAEGVIATNPAAAVSGPERIEDSVCNSILPSPVVAKLLSASPPRGALESRDYALIATIAYAFATPSALTNVRQSGLTENTIRLENRKGVWVEVPLNSGLKECLSNYVEVLGKYFSADDPLFPCDLCGPGKKTAMSRFAISQVIRRRAEAMELPVVVNPRSLRATAISCYLENGGSAQVVSEITGVSIHRAKKYCPSIAVLSGEELDRIRF